MWGDFKRFAFKGNVLDMAIGVIVGGAFGKIVTSIVNDIIMPAFGFLTSGTDFKQLKWVLSPAVFSGDKVVKAEAAILYGNFIQNIVDFFIISASIFLAVRVINKMKSPFTKEEEEKSAKPAAEIMLLEEIRDLLKEKKRAH